MIYKPEDFDYVYSHTTRAELADLANKLLLERSTVVYGIKDLYVTKAKISDVNYDYTARIFGIEEIKKEPCRHEAILIQEIRPEDYVIQGITGTIPKDKYKCRHCGIPMRPVFESVTGEGE